MFLLIGVCYMVLTAEVNCDQVLRLADKRIAVFELREMDKIHALRSTHQLEVNDLQECIDKCTETMGCKSVNFHYDVDEPPHQCQLVEYDVNLNPIYNTSIGWHQYDTGYGQYTKITHTNAFKVCVRKYPTSTPCDYTSSNTYIKSYPESTCNTVDAWFHYNPVNGMLYHVCSGKYIEPSGSTSNCYLYHKRETGITSAGRRFRRSFIRKNMMVYKIYCIGPYGPERSLRRYSNDENYIHTVACSVIFDSDYGNFQFEQIERGPVKVSLFKDMPTSQFPTVFAHQKWTSNTPDQIGYQDDMHIVIDYVDGAVYKVEALLVPRITGYYTFYLSCYSYCRMYLGEDATPTTTYLLGRRMNGFFVFDPNGSPARYLVEGKQYYISAVLVIESGAESLHIGLKYPDEDSIHTLERDLLQPYPE